MSDVDVLIPCFNAGRYVGAALDSALEQDVRPARIIVIDDGSTDDSAAVVRAYGPPVEYHHQANAGISAARNAAAARAGSPYLAFLDADDLWVEHSLSCRLEYLATHPAVDGVFAALSQFISPELEASLAGRYRFDPEPSTARFAGTLLVRTAAFRRAGPFDENLRLGEMIEWLARAGARGLTFHSLTDHVLRRRIHDANTVLRNPAPNADYLRAVRDSLKRKRGLEPEAS